MALSWNITDTGNTLTVVRTVDGSATNFVLDKQWVKVSLFDTDIALLEYSVSNKIFYNEFQIDYNDVTAPVSVSGADLVTNIQALIDATATVTDATISMSDTTTNNSSTTKHGFLKKLDNTTYNFMNGVGSWAEPFNYSLRAYSILGSVVLAEPINGNFLGITGGASLTNQQLRFIAVYLPQAATITGVKWFQSTQGDYTANNYNGVGLYSISAGTMTLRASSTDDGNIWKAASATWASKAFSSTYAAAAGVYFVAALWCRSAQVTAPSLGQFPQTPSAAYQSFDFSNSVKLNGTIASQTALPSPTQAMTGVTGNNTHFYFGLY